MTVEGYVSETVQLLLADAQTSGGLLIACPPERTGVLRALEVEGDTARVVGQVTTDLPDGWLWSAERLACGFSLIWLV